MSFKKCHLKNDGKSSYITGIKNFANFIGKHPCWNHLLIPRKAKKQLQHRCFPMKFAKFLRTPIFTKLLRWLFLKPHSG